MLRVRQIYFEETQKIFNMQKTSDFTPYLNIESNEFLESGVIHRMFLNGDHEDSSYYGVVSHKFYQKLNKSSSEVFKAIRSYENDADVYSFFPKLPKKNLITEGDKWHDLFSDIYKLLANKLELDINVLNEKHLMEPIYSNHWIAKREVFEEYCKDFLLPAIDQMSNNKLLRDLCNQDANYISRTKISPQKCLKVFNKPYYTYHCFILERLFPVFCYLRNKTVKHI